MTHITQGRIKLAEFARNTHVAVAPNDVTLADALDPAFWSHVALGVRAWDRIELRAEDDSWFAELIVFKASRLEVHVGVLAAIARDGSPLGYDRPERDSSTPANAEPGVPAGYTVNYGGPLHKHRVIRSADSAVLTYGLSKKEAIEWAREHAAGNAPEAKVA